MSSSKKSPNPLGFGLSRCRRVLVMIDPTNPRTTRFVTSQFPRTRGRRGRSRTVNRGRLPTLGTSVPTRRTSRDRMATTGMVPTPMVQMLAPRTVTSTTVAGAGKRHMCPDAELGTAHADRHLVRIRPTEIVRISQSLRRERNKHSGY